MTDHVTFFSEAFNKTEEKENFINPCCFGEDVAEWLVSKLKDEPGIAKPDFYQEDWGWQMALRCNGRPLYFCIGQVEIGDALAWGCFVQSGLPFYKKWFGAKDDAERLQLCRIIAKILESNPEINQIRWSTPENFQLTEETASTQEPQA